MARLWPDQGERAKAYDLLAFVYDCFAEGFGAADLKHVNMLLDVLGLTTVRVWLRAPDQGGQSVTALPRCSDVDLLRDRDRVIDLDPKIFSYRALHLV